MKFTPRLIFTRLLPLVFAGLTATRIAVATPLKLSEHPKIQQYINTLVKQHQFNRKQLTTLFQQVELQPKVIASITRPYETHPWDEYRQLFITQERIAQGVEFWHAHDKTLKLATHHYGVPPEVIVAILGVETYYGKRPPTYRAIDALTTLAFGYPKRSKFFKSELTHLLLLSRETHIDPLKFMGSYAGALGLPQFMPSSYRRYAIGFHKIHRPDLVHDPDDAITSIANYLHEFGWKKGQPIANHAPLTKNSRLLTLSKRNKKNEYWTTYPNFYVITHYNTSVQYAMTVHQLAKAITKAKKIGHG